MRDDYSLERLAQRIVSARKTVGLKQFELAEKVGVSGVEMCHVEAGRHIPRSLLLKKIASVCCVSTDYLLGSTTKSELKDMMEDSDFTNFLYAFKHLSPRDKRFILREIDNLIHKQSFTESTIDSYKPVSNLPKYSYPNLYPDDDE